jgi:hypothetical protein
MTSTNSTTTTTTNSTTTGNSPRNGTTDDDDDESSRSSSALRDNIARKGSHAYYFAHAHQANGPQWDGQPQPRLLSRGSTLTSETSSSSHHSSTASNITTYAFHDNGNNVKLYVALEHVGERCSDEDISLDYTETSLSLMVRNYQPQPQCLRFGKLTAPIQSATWKKKDHRLILTIVKQEPREWHTIHDTGAPDQEVV